MSIAETAEAKSVKARVPAKTSDSESGSIAGVLIFCGIGLGLSVFAAFANWIELPQPIF